MYSNGGQGMGTLKKIIQSVRVNNNKVGPKHHMHDKHYKEWLKVQSAKNNHK